MAIRPTQASQLKDYHYPDPIETMEATVGNFSKRYIKSGYRRRRQLIAAELWRRGTVAPVEERACALTTCILQEQAL